MQSVIEGDVMEELRRLGSGTFHCVVTFDSASVSYLISRTATFVSASPFCQRRVLAFSAAWGGLRDCVTGSLPLGSSQWPKSIQPVVSSESNMEGRRKGPERLRSFLRAFCDASFLSCLRAGTSANQFRAIVQLFSKVQRSKSRMTFAERILAFSLAVAFVFDIQCFPLHQ